MNPKVSLMLRDSTKKIDEETKMTVYRSKHTGKIYKVAEWPDPKLVVILVKRNKAEPYSIDYSIGPFRSVDMAENALKEMAELCGWEEINSD